MDIEYNPSMEGKTHVNIYSGSKLELGRRLSNFYRCHFEVEGFGSFASMEAFYYYVSTGCRYNHLRRLAGAVAKVEGKRLSPVKRADFEAVMRQGIRSRYNTHREELDPLILAESRDQHGVTLPFTHYYCRSLNSNEFSNYNWKVVVPKGNAWLVDEWTQIQTELFLANPFVPPEEVPPPSDSE